MHPRGRYERTKEHWWGLPALVGGNGAGTLGGFDARVSLMSLVVMHEEGVEAPPFLGGKGASLWSMAGAGLPVPPAVWVTAEAHRLWVESGTPDELPARIHDELMRCVGLMEAGGGAGVGYAVRSSAIREDSGSVSFAGMLETTLNVPKDEVPAKVLSVWRSAHSAEVASYESRMEVSAQDVAVVVQPLVPADVSGVIFTADPVTGDTGRVVVNASWGLGEAVVAGLVTPDQWVVNREGRVLEERIGEKTRKVQPGTGGGTSVVPVEAGAVMIPSLDEDQVAMIVDLALKAEAHFGSPQDVEWAYHDGAFSVLQSRPITGTPGAGWASEFDSDTDEDTVWTSANIQEVVPGVVTPLDWSLLHDRQNYALRKPFLETRTLLDPDTEFVAMFYGRVFANVSALRSVASRAVGTSPEAIDEQYLGVTRDPDAPGPRPSLAQLMAYMNTTPRILRFLYRTGRDVPRARERLRPWLERTRREDLGGLTTVQLMERIDDANVESREMAALHIAATSGASIYFESLGKLLRKWFGPRAADLEAGLVTGLADVPSAAVGLELRELAGLAAGEAALRGALSGSDPWTGLRDLNGASAAAFRAALARFLERHSHRGARELEVTPLAWEEDPKAVLGMVLGLIDVSQQGGREYLTARQVARREQATRDIETRLGPLKRQLFRFWLRRAQRYVAYREQTKALWMEVNHRPRLLFREMARRLHGLELLEDPSDLYFLSLDEVRSVALGEGEAADIPGLVRRRRVEFARNQRVRLPGSFQGRPVPVTPEVPEGRVLTGIPVCPGVVTGPARVVLDPRGPAVLEPGEILVAPVTDVAWTPLFLNAAGLVVDVGGPLSHGSIVAREYGLPTVVNVKAATGMIASGQTITVNGSTGEVILEEPDVGTA